MRVPGVENRSHIYKTPRTTRLVFDRHALVDLTIDLPPQEAVRLRPEIPITRLDLNRVPEHVSAGAGVGSASSSIRPIPTLLGGTIVFEDLIDKQIVLHPGQPLYVHPIQDAQLLQVALDKERITFTLRATVAGLKTGHSGQRNLMPNRLQYLESQDWAKFAAGVITALLAVLTILVPWAQKRRESRSCD
jgi:hypothetical protein